MDEHKPLAYFTPGTPDEAQDPHAEDRRMTFTVIVVGVAMVIGVFTIPEFVSMLNSLGASGGISNGTAQQSPAPSAVPSAALPATPRAPVGRARIVMALEAYREEHGVYPARLAQLRPRFLDKWPEDARWRYYPTDDDTDYELRYVADGPRGGR